MMNTLLVDYAYKFKVSRFIGILSTCIYPDKTDLYPMTEDALHIGPPTPTNFSYGYAKRCLAVHIDACNKQYGTKYQYLTPCNLYGEHDKFGENSHFVAALIKKIHEAKVAGEDKITSLESKFPNCFGVTKIFSGFALTGNVKAACWPSTIFLVRATVNESVKVKKPAGNFLINSLILGCSFSRHLLNSLCAVLKE